jgi:hypothetical protein
LLILVFLVGEPFADSAHHVVGICLVGPCELDRLLEGADEIRALAADVKKTVYPCDDGNWNCFFVTPGLRSILSS